MSDAANTVTDAPAAAPAAPAPAATPAPDAGSTPAATPEGTLLTSPAPAADPAATPDGTKPADATPAEGDKSGEAESEKKNDEPVKPEPVKAEDLKLSEGMKADTELTGELATLATELNLTTEQAQRFADLGEKLASRVAAQPETIVKEAKEAWAAQTTADKEFGGDKLQENLATAKRAMDAFATPELKSLLDVSGLGNHPEMIRAFYRAGKMMSEDTIVPGSAGAPNITMSAADRLYGTPNVAK